MAYDIHRVFCAAPGDLDDERDAFHQVIGEFNEQHAMSRNVLLVPVCVMSNVADMRSMRSAIKDNIRACRYYIQILEDTWGYPQRNFEREYAVAQSFVASPDSPMQEVALIFKKPLLPQQVEANVAALRSATPEPLEFEDMEGFKSTVRTLLTKWLETMASV